MLELKQYGEQLRTAAVVMVQARHHSGEDPGYL
jgi:hypothetical protein